MAGFDTGVLGCATFNSDTIIQVGGSPTTNPSFTFTLPVGGPAPGAAVPQSYSLNVVNFDPTLPANPTYNVSAVTYTPFLAFPLRWLTLSQTGLGATGTETLTVSANANQLDPGVYTATFTVTPQQGDNAGIPQTVTVTLDDTGQLLTNSAAGGGVPMNVTVPECSVTTATTLATQACNFTVTNGLFADGSATKTIAIPVLSVVNTVQNFAMPIYAYVRFGANPIDVTGSSPSVGTAGNFLDSPAPSFNTPGPAGGASCQPLSPPGNGTASSNVCYITVTIDASTFATIPNGSYTDKLSLFTTGLFSPITHAPEDSQIVLPPPISFTVTVSNNALGYFGGYGTYSEMSSPACGATNPCPGLTTISEIDTLDAINMNTTTSVPYTATATSRRLALLAPPVLRPRRFRTPHSTSLTTEICRPRTSVSLVRRSSTP